MEQKPTFQSDLDGAQTFEEAAKLALGQGNCLSGEKGQLERFQQAVAQ